MKTSIKKSVGLKKEGVTFVDVRKLIPENYRYFELSEIEFEENDVEASYIFILKSQNGDFDIEELLLPFSESGCTVPFTEFDLQDGSIEFEIVPRSIHERFPNPNLVLTFNCH